MNIILDVPVIIKVLGSLAVFIAVHRLSKNLLVALGIGTLLLAFWSGHTIVSTGMVIRETVTSPNSLFLFGIIFLVIWLSSQMEEAGLLSDLVTAVKARCSNRLAMAVLPAVIGLLPMPGGAYFSAPMVDECDPGKNVKPILKTNINFWFRHIWEYWWPLYPGVIKAIDPQNFNLPLWIFIPVQLPFWAIAVGAGIVFYLRKVPLEKKPEKSETKGLLMPFLPIIVIAVVYALVKIFIPVLGDINKYLPFVISIVSAMTVLAILRPLAVAAWRKILFSMKTIKIWGIIFLATIYGGFIQAQLPSGVFLMDQMKGELDSMGIPILLLVMALPLLSGLTTGITVGFVGASFPIIVSLLGTQPLLSEKLSMMVLAYGCGYAGIILSPVHTCLVMTNEYFKTSLAKSIRNMLFPAFVIVASAVGFYFLIRTMGFINTISF
ncbi:MAG: DUF401 family protein [Spirochaetales bacterium]|nr:DUF401 family protein [Spirochaetales bacterium]